MPAGITRLGSILMVIAILLAGGGHWAVLQTIAWGGMLMEYSENGSLVSAVKETFDGQHPCSLCRTIEKGKQTEKKETPQLRAEKLTLFCALGAAFFAPDRKARLLIFSDRSSEPRFIEPLLEPPRLALS